MLSYPRSEYVPRARQLIAETRERLAKHEQYVADFYWKRNAWKGAAGRLVGLADNYGDLGGGKVRSDSLWRAGEAYRNLKDTANERKVLARAKSVYSKCVRPVFVNGDHVVIRWIFRFEWLDGTVTQMEELAYQRWDQVSEQLVE